MDEQCLRFAKILEELKGSRGEVQTSSENCGFPEKIWCVKEIVHERARLTAVWFSVCEALLSPREVVACSPDSGTLRT